MFWMITELACYENRNPLCHHLTMAPNDSVIGLPHWVQRRDLLYLPRDNEKCRLHSFTTKHVLCFSNFMGTKHIDSELPQELNCGQS